jgi:hypothetical protein
MGWAQSAGDRNTGESLPFGFEQIEGIRMKRMRSFLLLAGLFSAVAPLAQRIQAAAAVSTPYGQQTQQPSPTVACVVDRELSTIEKQVVEAAEAMPEDKFNFTPESLNIPGDDYKGVRTFAVQVKPVASSNYFLWSPLTYDHYGQMVEYLWMNGIVPPASRAKSD